MAAQRKFLITAVACVAATVALAGCGGSDDGGKAKSSDGKGSSSSKRTAASTPDKAADALAGLSAEEIAKKAYSATKGAGTALANGTEVTDGDTTKMAISVTNGGGGQCTGTMYSPKGAPAEIVGIGKATYMKGSDAFWTEMGGGEDGGAMLKMLKGKWMKTGADSSGDEDDFCSLASLLSHLKVNETAGVTKGADAEVDGKKAVTLVKKSGAETRTYYVAAEGQPYFLKVETKGGKEPNSYTLTDFGKPVTATLPPASQVVDLDKLAG
ncbi:hypothetical protein [Streptomyces sp. NBC_01465]|uniref:hypothetical protein n=1 Tax=Streptomyces sp. NBC_01465 TaxID=2903878 RepID=UPI002E37D62D|nr:hypothetical protein [Streptomyces sp. NBC_01465]